MRRRALLAHAWIEVKHLPGQSVVDSLAAQLQPNHLLLILDICEHVMRPALSSRTRLLSACPRLWMLVTSSPEGRRCRRSDLFGR